MTPDTAPIRGQAAATQVHVGLRCAESRTGRFMLNWPPVIRMSTLISAPSAARAQGQDGVGVLAAGEAERREQPTE